MILHVLKRDDVVYYYYYNDLEEKVGNASSPNGYYATDIGYISKAEAKAKKSKIYTVGNTSFGCTDKKVDELIVELKPDKIIFLASDGMFEYYNYLVRGDSFDGLKKADLKDGFEYPLEKLIYRAAESIDVEILTELETIYKYTGKTFHKDMGPKYWHPKRSANNNFLGNVVVLFPNLPDVYLGVKIKDDGEIGKGIRDLNYTVVKGDKDERLKNTFDELKNFNKIVPLIVHVCDLHSELAVRSLSLHNELIAKKVFGLTSFTTTSGVVIGKIYTPPNLMFIVGEDIDLLYKLIPSMEVMDITSIIYDKDFKPTKEVDNGSVWVKTDKTRIKLVMGVDTVSRNMFAKYKKENPKVELLCKVYPKIIRYYTRITFGDTEIISYAPQNSLKIMK